MPSDDLELIREAGEVDIKVRFSEPGSFHVHSNLVADWMCRYDSFIDSVFCGLGYDLESVTHVAIIWHDAQRIVNHQLQDFIDIFCVFDFMIWEMGEEICLFLVGEGENFPVLELE